MRTHVITSLAVLALCICAQSSQDPAKAAAPEQPKGLTLSEAGAFDGYTLFAPIRSKSIFLIDMKGEVVHRLEHGFAPLGLYLLDNGHVVVESRIEDNPVFFGGGIAGRLRELDWDGNLVWEYVLSDEKRILHHDIEPLPNGHWLAIAWEYLSPDQATALGRDPAAIDSHGWWPDAVLELEPTRPSGAKIVWEWRAQDHLIQDFDRTKAGFGSVAEHPERIDINADHRDQPPMTEAQLAALKEREKKMRELGYAGDDDQPADASKDAPPPNRKQRSDWLHLNSVHYDAANDLILLSSPRLDEIFVIDHSTTTDEARGSKGGRYKHGGDLLYRWGNPRNYGAGEKRDQQLFGQHQAEWIPAGLPGAGHVILFNNEHPSPEGTTGKEFSSVDELVLPFDPKLGFTRESGKAFGPRAPLWSYTAPAREDFHSFFISGCQRLANGNTFICSGQQGRLFEVKPDGHIVWEYWNPYGGEIEPSAGKANPNKGGGRPSPELPISVFRAARIARDHAGLKGRELRPQAKQ